MPATPSAGGSQSRSVPASESEELASTEARPTAPAPDKPAKRKSRAGSFKKKSYKEAPKVNALSAELIAKIKELDSQGRTILANKAYREATGTSFRDAEREVRKILEGP